MDTIAKNGIQSGLFALAFASVLAAAPQARAAGDGGASDGGSESADAAPSGAETDASDASSSSQQGAAGSGDAGDAGEEGGVDSGLACNGALCDTTNSAEAGGSCAMAAGGEHGVGVVLAMVGAVAALGALRKKRRGAAVVALGAVSILGAAERDAWADPPAAVDVAIKPPPPEARTVTVEWNPLAFVTIGRLSANVVVAPVNHHALILSPFYAWATTNPISVVDASGTPSTRLPVQKFRGFGGELGYRYYFAEGGPRGLFLGPSLVLGAFDATPQVGAKTSYLNLGLAADVGYEALVADRLALALGAGLQYTAPTKSIPDQQYPAEIYANAGLRPRVLASIGWAF